MLNWLPHGTIQAPCLHICNRGRDGQSITVCSLVCSCRDAWRTVADPILTTLLLMRTDWASSPGMHPDSESIRPCWFQQRICSAATTEGLFETCCEGIWRRESCSAVYRSAQLSHKQQLRSTCMCDEHPCFIIFASIKCCAVSLRCAELGSNARWLSARLAGRRSGATG